MPDNTNKNTLSFFTPLSSEDSQIREFYNTFPSLLDQLTYSIYDGDITSIAEIIQSANIDRIRVQRNSLGFTALTAASFASYVHPNVDEIKLRSIYNLLLREIGYTDIIDGNGYTAFTLLLRGLWDNKINTNTVMLIRDLCIALLRHGANPYHADGNNQTPMEIMQDLIYDDLICLNHIVVIREIMDKFERLSHYSDPNVKTTAICLN